MGDIQNRPFSKNYSGLINQSVIAMGIAVLCIGGQEIMKRKRRGKVRTEGLGSRESWEFGYLYQGRSWARVPSPPSPKGWILSWIDQVIKIPEAEMLRLRGIDATLYVRFLRGCFWWSLLHTITTFPILFALHVHFSDEKVSPKSMTRASISSLVLTEAGKDLLWVHICFVFWLTITWIGNLLWVCHGAFSMRQKQIDVLRQRMANQEREGRTDDTYYPHPHPQYAFRDVTKFDPADLPRGLQCRTVMVTNIPATLRTESELKEYFEYYLCRKVDKPAIGLTSSTQPGFLNKSFAFLFNRAKRLPGHLPTANLAAVVKGGNKQDDTEVREEQRRDDAKQPSRDAPVIERVVMVRKLTELASLLERREDILQRLETAHIKLAKKTLTAVCNGMQRQKDHLPMFHKTTAATEIAKARDKLSQGEGAHQTDQGFMDPEDETAREHCMQQLIEVLGPYVEEFELTPDVPLSSKLPEPKKAFRRLRAHGSEDCSAEEVPGTQSYPPSSSDERGSGIGKSKTIWDALLSVPRSYLDAYQPLVDLATFGNKLVPSIDYYTLKLNFLCSLIVEQRAKAVTDHAPVSTAFVTFADPADARRACQYLAVHPNNPLTCIVTPAPAFNEMDWTRLMKLSFTSEFVKDWVVNVGVWGFTIFWLFPVSLLVGLVSIQNISTFWPNLRAYLDKHPWEEEVIQSFLPTLLVALLAITVPLILLLIGKKAHTITTLSVLHDRIMTRYYKFLIVNVLVFFCVGTTALQSFLTSFRETTGKSVLDTVATSFPSAGPFYVGWLIFNTAMHAGFELALLGLPLIMYPSTRSQVTPRKRAVGTRPRTFNYYYWLPNHLLVLHVLLVFSVLNPFVWPFGTIYFFIESGVVKNQLIHVYAKHYEQNGHNILIRIVRYSLDGAVLTQVVFLAYMVVLDKKVNVGLTAFLMVFTIIFKVILTRICRYQFELDDIREGEILCGAKSVQECDNLTDGSHTSSEGISHGGDHDAGRMLIASPASPRARRSAWSSRFPAWANLSYATVRRRPLSPHRRTSNPFRPQEERHFRRLSSLDRKAKGRAQEGSGAQDPSPLHRRTLSKTSQLSAVLVDPQVISFSRSPHELTPSVVPHAPPTPWDDNPNVELPYDNPYYTRTITNALWLPRNPFGILDLDDTVDLDASITTTSSKGEMGQWMGDTHASRIPPAITVTPDASLASPAAEELGVPGGSLSSAPVRLVQSPYTGEEEIELPPILRKRAQSRDGDIERVPLRRPSTFGRRTTGSSGRPSTARSQTSFRSVSAGEQPRDRTHSIMSIMSQNLSLDRAKSADNIEQEFGIRPQRSLLSPSLWTSEHPGSVITDSSHHALTRAGNISAHDAIVHEVLAEQEQVEAEEREFEEAERERQNATRSWFSSWMFRKAR